jgi:hypothetical protein
MVVNEFRVNFIMHNEMTAISLLAASRTGEVSLAAKLMTCISKYRIPLPFQTVGASSNATGYSGWSTVLFFGCCRGYSLT